MYADRDGSTLLVLAGDFTVLCRSCFFCNPMPFMLDIVSVQQFLYELRPVRRCPIATVGFGELFVAAL